MEITLSAEEIDEIINGLMDDMPKKIPSVIKAAVNQTAKNTKKSLVPLAKEKYAVKAGRLKKDIKMKNATVRELEAIIESSGHMLGLIDFKVNPGKAYTGDERPNSIKAKVIKANAQKEMVQKDGNGNATNKAFVVKFASGRLAVVERDPEKVARNTGREALKVLYSPSVTQLLGNKETLKNKIEPQVKESLRRYIFEQMDALFERADR